MWRFARDIVVNVCANVIAGAVLYFGAVAAGYLVANKTALLVAGGILAGAAVLLTVAFLVGKRVLTNAFAEALSRGDGTGPRKFSGEYFW